MIEVMLVAAILGILVAIALPYYKMYECVQTGKGREQCKAEASRGAGQVESESRPAPPYRERQRQSVGPVQR